MLRDYSAPQKENPEVGQSYDGNVPEFSLFRVFGIFSALNVAVGNKSDCFDASCFAPPIIGNQKRDKPIRATRRGMDFRTSS